MEQNIYNYDFEQDLIETCDTNLKNCQTYSDTQPDIRSAII